MLFKHASVTTYVLVTTTGQVPAEASVLVTTRLASEVHASLIIKPNPSSAATVDTAGVASEPSHPSTVVVAMEPVMAGDVVSSTFMISVDVVLLPHASVTTYVRVTTIGHVPDETSVLVTVIFTSAVQASPINNPNPSSATTVVTGDGASDAAQPSTVVVAIVPVIVGDVLSSTFMI